MRFPACLIILLSLLSLPAAATEMRSISGQIMVLERMALPETTTIIVDISTAGDRGLAQSRAAGEGRQSPFDFRIDAPIDADLVLRVGLRADDDMFWLSEPRAIAAGSDDLELGSIRALRAPQMGFATLLICGNTLVEIGFLPDSVRLRLNEQVLSMSAQPAASGALYVDPANPASSIHTKGDSALLKIDGAELSECRFALPEVDFTQGLWNISSIRDKPTLFPSRTELVFFPDGRVSATVGCNRLIGGYRRHGGILSFGRIASTRIACPDGLDEQERTFADTLSMIDGYLLDSEATRLTLTAGGVPVIQARK
jgi:heat shock protein HslJ